MKALLDEELGVQPEPLTLELVRDIRRARAGAAQAPPGGAGPLLAVEEASSAAPLAPPGRQSIAVLPVRALSADTDAGFLGEGIAEDVLVELSLNTDFLVVSRQSSFRFSAEREAPQEIGERLGVRFLLSGSVRVAGERLRVTTHLVRCADQREMWAERYDRDIADLCNIQTDIARSVAGAVVGRTVESERRAALGAPSERLEGFALAMRGLRHMTVPGPPSSRPRAIAFPGRPRCRWTARGPGRCWG